MPERVKRVICIKKGAAVDWDHYDPDPDAPSISEIVKVLEEASEWEECGEGLPHRITRKIDNLVERLES